MALRLNFWSLDGRHTTLSVPPSATKSELITRLVESNFAGPGCRLSLVKGVSCVRLDEGGGVAGQGLQDDAEVLVLPSARATQKRPLGHPADPEDVVVTEAMVIELTKGVAQCLDDRTGMSEEPRRRQGPQLMDVVSMLLKISRSLQAVITGSQQAEPDAAGPASPLPADTEEAELDPYADVDEGALQGLLGMGFPESRAKKALVLTGNEAEAAMEWLFAHENDPDIDAPLPPPPKPMKTVTGSTFTPDAMAFRGLCDMGFAEKDVLAALQLTRNNFNAACEWLISGKDVHGALEEREGTMDLNNPIMKEVLKDAHVQASLVDPRICKALQALVDDPQRGSAAFLHDPVISSVIMFLSRLIQRAAEG